MRMASAASEFIEGDFYTDSDIRDLEDVDADREAFVQRSPDIKDTLGTSNDKQGEFSLAAKLAFKKSNDADKRHTADYNIGPAPSVPHTASIGQAYSRETTTNSNYTNLTVTHPNYRPSKPFSLSVDYLTFDRQGRYLIDGTLWKLCPSFPVIWQSRYFVLKPDGSIYYYYNKSDYLKGAASRGVIAISDVRAELPGSGILVVDNKLQISVHSKWGRTYHIMCNSNEEARRWEREIRPFLPYRSRNNTMQTNVSLTSHFQRAESDEDDPVFELFVGQNSQKFSKV